MQCSTVQCSTVQYSVGFIHTLCMCVCLTESHGSHSRCTYTAQYNNANSCDKIVIDHNYVPIIIMCVVIPQALCAEHLLVGHAINTLHVHTQMYSTIIMVHNILYNMLIKSKYTHTQLVHIKFIFI